MAWKSVPLYSLAVIIILQISLVNSANILFYHHIASYSHRVVSYPLANALAEQGHHVTYMAPCHHGGPLNPQIKDIVPKAFEKTLRDFIEVDYHINLRVHKLLPPLYKAFYSTAITACEALLKSPEFEDYLKQTKTLDLIFIDSCIAECGAAIAYMYGAKIITFGTVALLPSDYDVYGFPPESSSTPELSIDPLQTPMSFLARVANQFESLRFRYEHYIYMQDLDKVVRKHLTLRDMPFLDEVARNVSLYFSSNDVVTEYPRSLPPLFVSIAGIHCRQGKPLPEKLETYINSGGHKNDGFVYISLGTLVVGSNLPEEIKQVFFHTMVSYPQLKFLWKWDGKLPENIPENLYLDKWFPQQDLLAHPKIKTFITQNGRPSTLESIYHAVPMISFPAVGDQDFNANRVNEMGANVILELGNVTLAEFKDALQKTVYDPRVKQRLTRLQTIFNDQPMTPLERALWWTDYVLRHPDTSHLQPTGWSQTWYQRRLLDVWAFVFVVIGLLLMLAVTLLVYVLQNYSSHEKSKSPKIKIK